jgi:hypothetical protein
MASEPTNPASDPNQGEPILPQREPITGANSVPPTREPDQNPDRPSSVEELPRREGVVSDPDMTGLEATPY